MILRPAAANRMVRFAAKDYWRLSLDVVGALEVGWQSQQKIYTGIIINRCCVVGYSSWMLRLPLSVDCGRCDCVHRSRN